MVTIHCAGGPNPSAIPCTDEPQTVQIAIRLDNPDPWHVNVGWRAGLEPVDQFYLDEFFHTVPPESDPVFSVEFDVPPPIGTSWVPCDNQIDIGAAITSQEPIGGLTATNGETSMVQADGGCMTCR